MANFVVKRTPSTARYFTEDLGDGLEIDMIVIPRGTFLMGSPDEEEGHQKRESPQHSVTVPTFFMGRYPVTQAQWRRVATHLPGVKVDLKADPSHFKGDRRRPVEDHRHPVERVNWHEAVEFCDRLSAHTKRIYRLPSEAEWEYACRAGTKTPFHFGETISTDVANYRAQDRKIGDTTYSGKYGSGEYGEFRKTTTPVDHFNTANAFGLVDMHGNVWEWCQDRGHDSYDGAPEDGSAWESGNDERRVLRGGSWSKYPALCRSARRYGRNPRYRYLDNGFRVVCAVPRTS